MWLVVVLCTHQVRALEALRPVVEKAAESMSGVHNEVDETRLYLQQLLTTVDGAEDEGELP